MSTTITPPKARTPTRYRFSRDEFHQMGDLGWFDDRFVQLLDGEIIEMPPPGNEHCLSTDRSAEQLRAKFIRGFWVRMQMPLDLNPYSEPLPDVAVVLGDRDTHGQTPTTALLVVEVSDSSLSTDRGYKSSLYACAGIADYWIVNLVNGQVEVHRDPRPDANAAFGFSYAQITVFGPNDFVSPLAMPQVRIAVADLLP